MAATVFDVEYQVLRESAQRIEDKTTQFVQQYKDIYNATTELSVKYKGQASETFNQRINEYQNDFQNSEKALKDYVQFLRDYAAKMERTEGELKSKAASLSIGQ